MLGTISLAGEAAARGAGRVETTGYNAQQAVMENRGEGSHGLGRDFRAAQKGALFGLSNKDIFMKMGEVTAPRV